MERQWSERHWRADIIRRKLVAWAKKRGVALNYIQPGKPQQNAYVERYDRTLRNEWLDLYFFESIDEVRDVATSRLWSCNHERPNMGIGGITPTQNLKLAAGILPTNHAENWGDYRWTWPIV